MSTRRDDRQAEAVGELHQPDRLAIAFGPGHSEIVLEAAGGVVAFLVADQHDPSPAEAAEPADDRLVLAEIAVAGERHEILDQAGDIILEMRPLGMAGDLGLLPRRQLGIGVAQQPVRALLEPADLGLDIGFARRGGLAQLGDSRLQLRDRLFEVEKGGHERRGLSRLPLRVNEGGGGASA